MNSNLKKRHVTRRILSYYHVTTRLRRHQRISPKFFLEADTYFKRKLLACTLAQNFASSYRQSIQADSLLLLLSLSLNSVVSQFLLSSKTLFFALHFVKPN